MRVILVMLLLLEPAASDEAAGQTVRWDFCHVPDRAILTKFLEYDLSIERQDTRVELTLQRFETVKRTVRNKKGRRVTVPVEEFKLYGSFVYHLGSESRWAANKVFALELSSEQNKECSVLVIKRVPNRPLTTASKNP